MGTILEVCPCGKNNDQYQKKNHEEGNEPLEITDHENQEELNIGDLTPIEMPQSVTDIKFTAKNMIQKRMDSPWEHYQKIKNLGAGAFGSVVKVSQNGSGNIRAMKIIPKDIVEEGTDIESIKAEIEILRSLDHPNIMKIYEFFEDDKNFYLLTEFCDKGDLGDLLKDGKKLPEFAVKYIMKQLLEIICYLHEHHIIHGDIKRENLLLYSKNDTKEDFYKKASKIDKEISSELMSSTKEKKGIKRTYSLKASQYLEDIGQFEVKLADFGCAKIFNIKKLNGIIGTTYYCSPEVLDNNYKEQCDEWSCGILMYILLVGEPPFDGDSEEEVIERIMKDKIDFNSKQLKNLSSDCKKLMEKLLIKNPENRITAKEALKEPFFNSLKDAEKVMIGETKNEDLKKKFTLLHKTTKYEKTSKFKEIVTAYICLNFVTKAEEEKIKAIFKDLSDDHSTYKISEKKFVQTITDKLPEISEEDAHKMFESIDNDHNGSLEYQELIRGLSDKDKLLNQYNLKEAFDFFDEDKSGAISWSEINRIISDGKNKIDNKQLMNEFLKEIGKGENEEITFDEFKDIMLK